MATRKPNVKSDEKKGLKRYVDQPGQWRDVTPASVKKRQAKAWKELEGLMAQSKKAKAKKKK